jgi:hypothetical protein
MRACRGLGTTSLLGARYATVFCMPSAMAGMHADLPAFLWCPTVSKAERRHSLAQGMLQVVACEGCACAFARTGVQATTSTHQRLCNPHDDLDRCPDCLCMTMLCGPMPCLTAGVVLPW